MAELTADDMISGHLERVSEVLEMIQLEIDVEKEVGERSRIDAIMHGLGPDPVGRTISAQLLGTYLLTLLGRSQMDEYFVCVGKLLSHYPPYPVVPFTSAVLEHMEREALPKLKYILAQAIDTQRPTLVLRAIQLIVTIVTALGSPLPADMDPFLLDRLRRLIRSIQPADYRNSSGYQRLVEMVNGLPRQPGAEADGLGREFARLRRLLAALDE